MTASVLFHDIPLEFHVGFGNQNGCVVGLNSRKAIHIAVYTFMAK